MQDVTNSVEVGSVDDECLPINKCVCGERFEHWDQVLSIYPEDPWVCPKCGAKLLFRNAVRVFKI